MLAGAANAYAATTTDSLLRRNSASSTLKSVEGRREGAVEDAFDAEAEAADNAPRDRG